MEIAGLAYEFAQRLAGEFNFVSVTGEIFLD